MKSLSENEIINVSGAGFGDYGGYTSGELGAKAGCAIDSILGVLPVVIIMVKTQVNSTLKHTISVSH